MARIAKAAIVHQFNKPLRIEQVAIPEPGPGAVLVNVKDASTGEPVAVHPRPQGHRPPRGNRQGSVTGLKEGDALGGR